MRAFILSLVAGVMTLGMAAAPASANPICAPAPIVKCAPAPVAYKVVHRSHWVRKGHWHRGYVRTSHRHFVHGRRRR
jgi:hypothetical protein